MANVVITGSSTGIGQAAAVSLARAGNTVYATMRNPDASGALLELAGDGAEHLRVRKLDVNSDASVAACFSEILAETSIDALVNNAGIGAGGAVEETPLAQFRDCMETNFFGLLRCTKAVLPAMRARGSGCIVNVSSIAGRLGLAGHGPYAASKFAVEGLSEALAQELGGSGIRVALVEPGVIATPIFEKGDPNPPPTEYPHRGRMTAFFQASLQDPVSPFVVGDLIRDIIASDSRQLRYPAGPDAVPLIDWRQSMSGEAWARLGELDDEGWAEELQRAVGLDIAPYLG